MGRGEEGRATATAVCNDPCFECWKEGLVCRQGPNAHGPCFKCHHNDFSGCTANGRGELALQLFLLMCLYLPRCFLAPRYARPLVPEFDNEHVGAAFVGLRRALYEDHKGQDVPPIPGKADEIVKGINDELGHLLYNLADRRFVPPPPMTRQQAFDFAGWRNAYTQPGRDQAVLDLHLASRHGNSTDRRASRGYKRQRTAASIPRRRQRVRQSGREAKGRESRRARRRAERASGTR